MVEDCYNFESILQHSGEEIQKKINRHFDFRMMSEIHKRDIDTPEKNILYNNFFQRFLTNFGSMYRYHRLLKNDYVLCTLNLSEKLMF